MTFAHGLSFVQLLFGAQHGYRYRLPENVAATVQCIVTTAKTRVQEWPSGSRLWRAQLGHGKHVEEPRHDGSIDFWTKPFDKKRMKPPREHQHEGRANAKGLSALYTATTPETAMAEVRPSLASTISLASLRTNRLLRVVDCELGNSRYDPFELNAPESETEGMVWRTISNAFSEPVDPNGSGLQYVATQMVSEHLRCAGYDGIKYKSGFGTGGSNLVLFDLDHADVKKVVLKRLARVAYDFEDAIV